MKNKEYVLKLLEEIEVTQSHFNAVRSAMNYASTGSYINRCFNEDLLDALSHIELDLWRRVFMFGMTLKDEDRNRVKAAAYQRFLSSGGREPSHASWLKVDEKEFREMTREVFAPKEK